MVRYAIWYHLHNLKNVKNTHGAVLNCTKSRNAAHISGRFLKDDATILAISLTQIHNLSLKLSHFPNRHKLTLRKSLCEKCSKNFRAISPLFIVSNIIMKIIHNQTMEYLAKYKILIPNKTQNSL